MKERIRTLLLDSNGAGWKSIAADTVLRGVLNIRDGFALPHAFDKIPVLREMALLFKQRYEPLSYVIDWRKALCTEPELEVEVCNINNLIEYRWRREAISAYPLIIILHSAAGDRMSLLLKTAHWFHRRRGKLVVFIGNEYQLMGEKFEFLRAVEADYVCSQLPLESARWLYSQCYATQVLAMPHALNASLYRTDPRFRRTLDIGFIGSIYPYFMGDVERTILINFFRKRGAECGLKCEVRTGNIPRREWAQFLNTCKGTIGAESGSYYLDRRGQIIAQAKAYLRTHPGARFDEVFSRFFQSPRVEYISGKCVSSRHFEPIGTKTCQILFEGHYNGILKADEHYICVKKDLSNIHDAVQQFKDESYRNEMVERTYEYVMDEHTYQHRIKTLLKTIRSTAKD